MSDTQIFFMLITFVLSAFLLNMYLRVKELEKEVRASLLHQADAANLIHELTNHVKSQYVFLEDILVLNHLKKSKSDL